MHCNKSGETKRFSGLIPPAPWIAAAYNRPACENNGWNRRRPRNKAGRGSPLRPNPYNATGVRYWLHFNFIFFWNKNTVFCILFQLLSALHKPDFHFSYPADVINIKKKQPSIILLPIKSMHGKNSRRPGAGGHLCTEGRLYPYPAVRRNRMIWGPGHRATPMSVSGWSGPISDTPFIPKSAAHF